MSLLASEVARIKAELGFNVLEAGAEPYIGIASVFEQVIQPYLEGGATTTSATTVTAATTPTAVTLTLADASEFTAGDRVVIDVDSLQESATIRSKSGSTISVLLKNGHSGTYPVTVEGPETIVREILRQISLTKTKMGEAFGSGSLKQVDEVEFFGTKDTTMFGVLGSQLAYWREQLAAVLGIDSMWGQQRSASATLAVF